MSCIPLRRLLHWLDAWLWYFVVRPFDHFLITMKAQSDLKNQGKSTRKISYRHCVPSPKAHKSIKRYGFFALAALYSMLSLSLIVGSVISLCKQIAVWMLKLNHHMAKFEEAILASRFHGTLVVGLATHTPAAKTKHFHHTDSEKILHCVQKCNS